MVSINLKKSTMIKFVKSLFILTVIGFLLFSSCNSKNKHIVKIGNKHITLSLQVDESAPINDVDTTISIIKKRLINYGIPQENIVISKLLNTINIEVKHADNPERIINIATSVGKFEFWETYEFKEIYSYLLKADEMLKDSFFVSGNMSKNIINKKNDNADSLMDVPLIEKANTKIIKNKEYVVKENPLLAYLALSIANDEAGSIVFLNGPVLGQSEIDDTAIVNKMLSMVYVNRLFPRYLKMAWTIKPQIERTTFLNLIALRCSNINYEPRLTGEFIVDVSQTIGQNGRVEISMSMNNQGASIWKDMTSIASKDKHSIAIVLDNKVYSYPMVMNEIPIGHSVLTGNFTKEEAEDLVTLIKFHRLPIKTTIIECKITEEPK